MKFTVIWRPAADAELIDGWMLADSDQRAAITLVTREIDLILKGSPETVGESRGSSFRRILFVRPLVVEYEIRPQDRLVLILSVLTR
jgi:hypothetical protein